MTVRILQGDCREVLDTLEAESVHCCVTSPPYWGLRSYLPDGHSNKHLEIGSEPTLQEWVDTMVLVFRKVRRVLRPDGVLLLNLGDAYAGSRCGGAGWPGSTLAGSQPDHSAQARRHQGFTADHKNASAVAKRSMTKSARCDDALIPRSDVAVAGLKPKDLMGQPWRVAFALQADGWWLRQEIIWHKPNPMPESVRDRCTKAHEHVFLLSKSEQYFWDFDAMQEPVSTSTHARLSQDVENQRGSDRAHGGAKTMKAVGRGTGVGFGHGYDRNPKPRFVSGGNDGGYADGKSERMGREPGWRKSSEAQEGTKNNSSFDAAMAVMPSTRNSRSVWTIPTHGFKGAHFATFPPALAEKCIRAGCPEGGTTLDPFGGSGTVGLECDRQHKSAILIDLDERNVPMAHDRIQSDAPLFAEVTA